jgi:hypothetical protein
MAKSDMTVWELYRKRFAFTQLTVFALAAVALLAAKMPASQVLVLVVVMELAAVFGTWWGMRIRRRLAARDDELPLQKGRR